MATGEPVIGVSIRFRAAGQEGLFKGEDVGGTVREGVQGGGLGFVLPEAETGELWAKNPRNKIRLFLDSRPVASVKIWTGDGGRGPGLAVKISKAIDQK